MTHPLPNGTVNFAVNLDARERSVWGKIAFEMDCSIGELFRRLVLKAIASERPGTAEEIKSIRLEHRRHYYGAILLVLFLGSMLTGTDDFRRARNQQVRVVRTQRRLDESGE